jgi:3-dehydroquinate synthase
MQEESLNIEMKLDGRSSRYILGPLACLELAHYVPHPPPVYLVDQAVAELHPLWLEEIQKGCDGKEQPALILPGGEQVKTFARLIEIYEWLAERDVPRDGALVAVGGGTILDLAGLAASTWRRGINFVAIPTTLLAMVDAAIGGKTAVNAVGLKNPVGTFHPADAILADCGFLATLPCHAWRDGMAEMIKTAVLGGVWLFDELYSQRGDLARVLGDRDPDDPVPHILGALPWKDWIGQAASIKARIVGRDFREGTIRRALNLGHTLGHALEAWSHGSDAPLTHGQAVSIGMAVVCRIAAERGTFPVASAVQVIELLECAGLPVRCAAPPEDELTRLLAGDKKVSSADGLRWVLPRAIGNMDIDGKVSVSELLKWLD